VPSPAHGPLDLFRGPSLAQRVLSGTGTICLGALVLYLLRGGWHTWPPPWPPLRIILYFGCLAAGGVIGGTTHYFTDRLRVRSGVARTIGNVLPFTLCFAAIGLGLLFLASRE